MRPAFAAIISIIQEGVLSDTKYYKTKKGAVRTDKFNKRNNIIAHTLSGAVAMPAGYALGTRMGGSSSSLKGKLALSALGGVAGNVMGRSIANKENARLQHVVTPRLKKMGAKKISKGEYGVSKKISFGDNYRLRRG